MNEEWMGLAGRRWEIVSNKRRALRDSVLDRDQKAQINIVTEAVQHQTFIWWFLICVSVWVRCRFFGWCWEALCQFTTTHHLSPTSEIFFCFLDCRAAAQINEIIVVIYDDYVEKRKNHHQPMRCYNKLGGFDQTPEKMK